MMWFLQALSVLLLASRVNANPYSKEAVDAFCTEAQKIIGGTQEESVNVIFDTSAGFIGSDAAPYQDTGENLPLTTTQYVSTDTYPSRRRLSNVKDSESEKHPNLRRLSYLGLCDYDCDQDSDCGPGLLCADSHKAELQAKGYDKRKADCGNVGSWNDEVCFDADLLKLGECEVDCDVDSDCGYGLLCADAHNTELAALGVDQRKALCGSVGQYNEEVCFPAELLYGPEGGYSKVISCKMKDFEDVQAFVDPYADDAGTCKDFIEFLLYKVGEYLTDVQDFKIEAAGISVEVMEDENKATGWTIPFPPEVACYDEPSNTLKLRGVALPFGGENYPWPFGPVAPVWFGPEKTGVYYCHLPAAEYIRELLTGELTALPCYEE